MANSNFFTINQTNISKFKGEWKNLLLKYCSDETKIDQTFQFVVEKYSENHRAYHNLSHINYLLEEARKLEFDDFEAIYFAAWFHDVIYDSTKSDNEMLSAKLAVKLLSELNFPKNKISKIEQIILATQTHSAEDLDQDGKVFLDLDLSILGANEEIYQNYSQAIRQEYSHVSDDLYRQGRKKILKNFLKREVIYFTKDLSERFEKQARINLINEIKELS